MFEDIITPSSDTCIVCGSDEYEYVDGSCSFLPGNRVKQLVKCKRCGSQRWIILNDKLEIVG